MKLARAIEMQNLDRLAIEKYGIPGAVLMENAGRGTVDCMIREFGPVGGKLVPVFVGPGNNGGDGLVIARHVHQAGGHPFIIYLVEPGSLTGDAALNCSIVTQAELPCCTVLDGYGWEVAANKISGFRKKWPVWSLVDAVFGTGLKRPLSGHFLEAVEDINRLSSEIGCPVTAVDIPSGLDADTGRVLGGCVRADLTVTYGMAKPGHFMHGGNDLVGKLRVVDISIPAAAVSAAGLTGEALEPTILKSISPRLTTSHKGTFGHLMIVAGSVGKTGAAILSAHGALRAGTGLVTLCVPADLNVIFETSLFEAMTVPLPNSISCHSVADHALVRQSMEGKTAVVLGPGLGTSSVTRDLVRELYREVRIPMVVDADGLNLLAAEPEILADPPAPRLLTPHPGEMARLSGQNTRQIQADRLRAVLEYSKTVNKNVDHVTLVLKGAGTVICDPSGTWAVNTTGNPGMAAAGMGDVLSGLLGGLLAQGYPAVTAARLGVFLHGLAADRLAQQRQFGYLAAEVAAMVPEIITEYFIQHRSIHTTRSMP